MPAALPHFQLSAAMAGLLSSKIKRLGSFWRWIATNKDSLTVTFAMIAGTTALYQYLNSVDDARRKETLKYVDRSQDTRVGQARTAVTMILLNAEKRKTYVDAANAASGKSKNAEALDRFVADNDLNAHLIVMTEQFMNLAGCVKAGVCDKSLACDFFKSDVEAVNNSFRQLFDTVWKERTGQNYMDGPLEFAKSCGRN